MTADGRWVVMREDRYVEIIDLDSLIRYRLPVHVPVGQTSILVQRESTG